MKINLGNYTWEEVRDLAESDPVILLPLGAFEQHGKHLPLKVDEFMVNNIANEAVRKAHQKNIYAVVTPVIWSGYSPHHMDFPGTISIKDETLTNLMMDIVESLVKNKLERILILNGHGGNSAILKNVGQKLKYDKNIYIATASYWDFAMKEINEWRDSDLGGINHACEMETALMLHMQEEIVKKDNIILSDKKLDKTKLLFLLKNNKLHNKTNHKQKQYIENEVHPRIWKVYRLSLIHI